VKVRRARPADVAAVAAIHVRSWQAAYKGILPEDVLAGISVAEREEHWRRLFAGNEHHWLNLVAEDETGLLGFCTVTTPGWDADAEGRLAEMGALYVEPDNWRQRIGSALLHTALEELAANAWSEVVLWVLPENRPALDFYSRFGFRVEDGVEKLEERSGRVVIRLRAKVGR